MELSPTQLFVFLSQPGRLPEGTFPSHSLTPWRFYPDTRTLSCFINFTPCPTRFSLQHSFLHMLYIDMACFSFPWRQALFRSPLCCPHLKYAFQVAELWKDLWGELLNSAGSPFRPSCRCPYWLHRARPAVWPSCPHSIPQCHKHQTPPSTQDHSVELCFADTYIFFKWYMYDNFL